jgi:hypothetical protein
VSLQLWDIDHFDSTPEIERGKTITLLTVEEFGQLPVGVELLSIMGKRVTVGKDDIHLDDTRGGYIPYGLELPGFPIKTEEQWEAEK